MTIELDKRTIRAIASEVAKLIRSDGVSEKRLIPCKVAAERLGISQSRLRAIKGRFSYVKRGGGKQTRLYFDADKLISEYQNI